MLIKFMNRVGFKELALFNKDGLVLDLLLITFLWCLAAILVNPIGDFPLNDDWAYGTAVKQLLQDGVYHPVGWITTTLFSQAIWGALFCIPFGFSFTALRFSTLLLALVGIIGFYLLLRQLRCNRNISFIAALILAFNPLYFALSYTFMTDVPFTACMILATFFFVLSLLHDSDVFMIIGTCLSVIAILCRQLGFFLPIAFGLALLLKKGGSPKNILRACFPTFLGLIGLIGLQIWLKTSDALPALYNLKMTELIDVMQHPKALFRQWILNTLVALPYFGIFLFPFVLLVVKPIMGMKKWLTRSINIAILLFIVISSLTLLYKGVMMPLSENVIIKSGIGPETLSDTYILGLPNTPNLPAVFWVLVTAISIAGSALLLYCFVSVLLILFTDIHHLKEDNIKIVKIFLLIGAIIYFLPIAAHGFFDRYLLPLLPVFCIAIIILNKQPDLSQLPVIKIVAMVSLILLSIFSIAGTRDYLAWNRIRWEAVNDLMKNGISPHQIDGGYEFTGLYLYNPEYQNEPNKNWQQMHDNAYVVTFGAIEGYNVIKQYDYTRWLPPQKENIFVLHRKPEPK